MRIFLFSCCLFFCLAAGAQYKLRGTVYDSSRTYPLEAVTVLTTAGKGAVTNTAGAYEIEVSDKDSVWFSYLGKPTNRFAVKKITDLTQFDLALRVPVNVLKEVIVKSRDYRTDSLQNRLDYAKAFNFQRPSLGSMTSIGANGAAIDLDELIRVFAFRKNKSMERFRERLLQEEREKYIDHRFNKALVRKLTHLDGDQLERFVQLYRPSYEFAILSSDYDFQFYILESFRAYTSGKGF